MTTPTPSKIGEDLRRRMSGFAQSSLDAWEQMTSPRANVTTRRGRGSAEQADAGSFFAEEEEKEDPMQDTASSPQMVRYGDTVVEVTTTVGLSTSPLSPGKIYDKTKRAELSALHKSTFLQDATRQVLKKRLALPSTKSTDQLEDLTNLEYQLTTLRDHMFVFDIDDCCTTILRPVSSQVSSDLQDGTWNLFEDYASLDPAVVANHLLYSHNWLNAAPYVRENISYVYMFLKNNTDEALWNVCQSDYVQYPELGRGGPLMLILMLRKILNVTESALTALVNKIQHLKISEIPGENVDDVVALVKAALKLVNSASKRDMVRLPLDFPKTLLEVYQTSSVPEFNDTFKKMLLDAKQTQYTSGGMSEWPDIGTINKVATTAYRSIKDEGRWSVPTTAQALHAGRSGRSKRANKHAKTAIPQDGNPRPPPHCWNCDGEHLAKDCPQPFNKEHFEANKRKWMAKRGNRRPPRNGGNPVQDDRGRPLKLNKHGQYVVDSGKLVRMQRMEALIDTVMRVSMASDGNGGASQEVSPAPPTASSVVADSRSERNRALLRERLTGSLLL